MATQVRDVEAIFNGAVGRATAEERQAYLDGACGDDLEARKRVEALLEAHSGAGSFLEAPVFGEGATVGASPLIEKAGTLIGPYKLLQPIGEGGFGAVYMAQQEKPVRRTVALKIIKLGMDTRQVIARFEAERQALAMMDHPNIAKVLDAGATETGRPYFVMELVKGIPITEYCDKNNLSTQERLDLFVDVCHAVQHAHQKGIIHRDIKPSNVMVTLHDGKPVPKVIDFGIAKATNQRLTEKTLFTEFRQFVGTPEYMSPEQAEMSGLDIDTRTDIYSLGVLLYELLTGTTPFDGKTLREAGYGEIQKIIREREPDRPSTRLSTMGEELTGVAKHRHTDPGTLRKQLKGDLDWIVMKAIEKDRTRRYETANGLAMDVTRYQVNEPVLATPPSAAYRLKKFVRRNKGAVTGGAAVAAALVLGLTAASIGLVQAKRHEAVAVQEAQNAATVAGFMQEMLASVDPSLQGGRDFTLVTMLEDAGKRMDDGALADQPQIEADMRATIGETYLSLDLNGEAEPQLQQALDIRRRQLGADNPETLDVMARLGDALAWQGRYYDAEPLVRAVYETRRDTLGEDDPQTLQAMYKLAWNSFHRGQEAEGERLHLECLQHRREVFGEDGRETATSWNCSGVTHILRGQFDQAEPFIRKAYEIGVQTLGEGHRDTLVYAGNLATVYINQQRFAEAEELLTATIPVSSRALGPTDPRTLDLIDKLTSVYAAQDRLEDARPWEMQAIDARKRRCEAAPSNPGALNACAWQLLACRVDDLRDPAEALKAALKANVLTDYRNPDYLDTLAVASFQTGDVAGALKHGRAALELLPAGNEASIDIQAHLDEFEGAAARQRGQETPATD